MAGYFPIVLYCLKKILNYLSYSALFTQKWLKIHLVEKKLDPGRLTSVCSEICFGLICFFFFYDKTDTISRKKEGTRMKKNERGKNVFPCEKWSCRLKEWVCFIYFFCLWRETNDLKVTSLLSHVWKWRNFCTTLAALCGGVDKIL